MKISEAARASGLSTHTIRYYEASGMLPGVLRGTDGHRRFSPENVDWLTLLASLRDTGMPLKTMRHFAGLYRKGDVTVKDRKDILSAHDTYLHEQQVKLAACRALLEHKLERYDNIIGATS